MTLTTTAAVCHQPDEPLRLEQVQLSDLRDDEVLVKITATGVCHMDIEGREMLPAPSIQGHEGVGIVQEVGAAVRSVKPGDRVVMSYAWCGQCHSCEHHQPYHCDESWDVTFSGGRLDGSDTVTQNGKRVSAAFFQQSSFAQHAICSERNLVCVDSTLTDARLAAFPCGILTGAGIVCEQFALQPGNSLAVFGTGAVGLAAIMAAKKLDVSPVIAVDINDERLELASALGATHVINAKEGKVAERIQEFCGRGAGFSIDTTGNAMAFNNAIECLAPGGRMAACILPSPMEEFTFKPFQLFVKSLSLEGVSFGRAVARELVPKLVAWHEAGEFPVERLIREYNFEDINQACQDSLAGIAIKPVLKMPD
jgi:aryl-alcohol dehydrogenase